MNCLKHENREAIAMCVKCHKLICEECAVKINNKYYCKRPSPTINNLHYYLLSTLPITITNEFRKKKDAPCKIQGNIHVFEPVESNCYAFTMIGD